MTGEMGCTQQEQDELYMRLALEEARLAAQEGEVPIGAVVVYDPANDPASPSYISPEVSAPQKAAAPKPHVIARAHNRREIDEDPSAHAEFSAMLVAARALGHWRLSGCTVYVTLEPCLMCAGLMVNARVERCVFGAHDPKGGALGSLYDVSHDERLNHAFEVSGGVLSEDCSQVLREFFRQRRRERKGKTVLG